MRRTGRLLGAVAAAAALVAAAGSAGTTSAPPSQPPTAQAAPGAPEPAGTVTAQAVFGTLPDDRPNIVVIMTDDMRDDELQWMPHVRRLLADGGVRFVNSFSPYPLCCPARASFLTGQYTHNHGVWTNRKAYGFHALDDTSTVATDLAAAGYRTAFLGKYLNGYGPEPPHDGSTNHSFFYVPPGWHEWRGSVGSLYGAGLSVEGGTYNYFDTVLNVNGELRDHGGVYQTRMFGRQTADMLAGLARSPRPFFLWASYVAPHIGWPREADDPGPVVRADGEVLEVETPVRPRDVRGVLDAQLSGPLGAVREDDMSDKPEFLRQMPPLNDAEVEALEELTRQRAEALHVVDEQVARTLEALEELGELDDTVVVFTSDNGYFLGEHGLFQFKRLPYQSSLRTPTILAGPGIPAGEERTDPLLTTDFAPTFLDLAGARSDRVVDGRSLLGVAREGDQGWTRPVFTEAGPNWLGHPAVLDREPGGPSKLRYTQGVRTPRYLYVEHATDEQELYDLRRDPLELTSLVDRPALQPTVRRLARLLESLRMCAGASCNRPMPPSLQAP